MKKEQKPRRVSRVFSKTTQDFYVHEKWNFPPVMPISTKVLDGLIKKAKKTLATMDTESICGSVNDMQHVEMYNGTLGVTQAFVANHQAPVGQLQWNNNLGTIYTNPGTVNNARWGSGTLIANDLFLTAGHCFDIDPNGWITPRDNATNAPIPSAQIAMNLHVNFNFQVDPLGNLRVEQSFPVTQLVEYRLGGVDFAIVRLGGNPGGTYGTTQVSSVDANDGDMLCIIQHPEGLPKRIEAGPQFHLHDIRIGYDTLDTLGGSSGSGILRVSTGRIVGVHTNGGCDSSGSGHNHGMRITSIIANSPTVNGLIGTIKIIDDPIGTFKVVDDPLTRKVSDDPIPTKKFIDDPIGTYKLVDDPLTRKFSDDPINTFKNFDDVKIAALDKPFTDVKLPSLDGFRPQDWGGYPDPTKGAQPFVLSTPHHSQEGMAASGQLTGDPRELEAEITSVHNLLQQLNEKTIEAQEYYQKLVEAHNARSQGQ
jgi:V8-like Glu-specific endopeptidase